MSTKKWQPIITAPENEVVSVLTPDGDERRLMRRGSMWFTADGRMYVYFTPTHWRIGTAATAPDCKSGIPRDGSSPSSATKHRSTSE